MSTNSQPSFKHHCPARDTLTDHHLRGEKKVFLVLLLTATTMVVELVAGTVYGSMALLADGWHMGTHVAAFLIAIAAYRFARKHHDNPAFSFGTGKVNVLGGFASAVALAVVALMMLLESLQRFFDPHAISFDQAIIVAIIGLVVNIASAVLLWDSHHHYHHSHDDDHGHHHHHDHNLKAAFIHVLADALTSVLAIVALLLGKFYGWSGLDPMMGIVGSAIISVWAFGLIKQSAPVLLDGSAPVALQEKVIKVLEDNGAEIKDLHLWRVNANHFALLVSLQPNESHSVEYYKGLLAEFGFGHVTVEIFSRA